MSDLPLTSLLWYFFIYAFLGWCCEVVYAALIEARFVNRGFLSGPLCPIYGFGVLLVLRLLHPFEDNLFLLFGGAVLITGAIEFAGGFLMEKFFHQRWWDYTDKPFNLMGYICLSFSLLWGLACLIVVDRIHPLVSRFVLSIPEMAGSILLALLSLLFAADLTAAVQSVLKLNADLKAIEEIRSKLRETSYNIGEKLADTTLSVMEKSEELKDRLAEQKSELQEDWEDLKKRREELLLQNTQELRKLKLSLLCRSRFGRKRLLDAFPSMRSTKYREALHELREHLHSEKNG